jgi:hypothetical protein
MIDRLVVAIPKDQRTMLGTAERVRTTDASVAVPNPLELMLMRRVPRVLR